MGSWSMFCVAFGAVLIHAWASRRGATHWYLGGIVPLLYGGIVAWMFVDKDVLLCLQIIIFGAVIPILLLLAAWWSSKKEDRASSCHKDDQPIEKQENMINQ